MKTRTWMDRLNTQLPGWHAWYDRTAGWYAVPAPTTTPEGWSDNDTRARPNRIGPYRKPQELRTAALDRYGWDEHCDTCGVLARQCGHRQPERETAHP